MYRSLDPDLNGHLFGPTSFSQSHVLHKAPTRPVHYSGGECVAFSRLSPSQGDEHLGTRAAGSHASGGSGSPASHATVSFPLGPTDLSTGARTNRSVSLSPQPMRMRGGGPMRCRQWKKQCNILSEGLCCRGSNSNSSCCCVSFE